MAGNRGFVCRMMDAVVSKSPPGTCCAKNRVLADLIEYAPGAVISRIIHRSAGVTITLVALDRGQGLIAHLAAYNLHVHVLDGNAHFTVDGREEQLSAGSTLRIAAGSTYSAHAHTRFKMLLVMTHV